VLINKQEYVLTLKNPGQSNPPPFSLRTSGTPAPPSAFATSIRARLGCIRATNHALYIPYFYYYAKYFIK
jgi:hypothetical protein